MKLPLKSSQKIGIHWYSFTTGLKNLIKEFFINETKPDMEDYIRILNYIKGSTNSKYYLKSCRKNKKV